MPAVRYAAEQSRRRLLKPSAWPSPWAVARALSTGRELLQRSRSLQLRLEPGTGRRRVRPTDPRPPDPASSQPRKRFRRRKGGQPDSPKAEGSSTKAPTTCRDVARRTSERLSARGSTRSSPFATTQLGAMFAADGHARRLDRRTNHDPPRMQIHFDKALPLGGCEHSQCESVSSQGVHGRLRPAAQPIPEFALRARAGPRRQGATRSRALRHPHDAVAVVAARHQIAGTRQERPGLVAEHSAAAQRRREPAVGPQTPATRPASAAPHLSVPHWARTLSVGGQGQRPSGPASEGPRVRRCTHRPGPGSARG